MALDAAVLVYAPFAYLALASDSLRAGASGLLHTGFPPQELRWAVSLALKGETVLPHKLLSMWLEEGCCTDLNLVLRTRQLEILRLALEGLTNAQIAQSLYLAQSRAVATFLAVNASVYRAKGLSHDLSLTNFAGFHLPQVG